MPKLPPVHPGEVLVEDFLKPMGITPNALAMAIGVPAPRIHEITKGRRAVTADTALRLARYFGTSARVWTGLQARYDTDVAEDKIAAELARIQPRQAVGG